MRAGVLVGLFVSCTFLCLSSCMLWNIEVSGNESIKTEKLMESLESNGVRVGAIKSKIDTADLEKQLLNEYNDLSWVSLNIFGTKAVLEVKENSKKPQIIDGSRAMNLVAKKAGQIVAVEGHKGFASLSKSGYVTVDQKSITDFTVDKGSNRYYYIVNDKQRAAIVRRIVEVTSTLPKNFQK